MTQDRWARIETLFHDALQLPLASRDAFLAERCSDAELRAEVASLLAESEDNAAFIDTALPQALAGRSGPPLVGRRIGVYRLERPLGAGGMGTVWLASRADAQFEKRAAVKLIKRGMDTDAILLRFRTERQVLANLEHPNIARLLDGGVTDDGLPYLVMEHVEGEPIDRYCDAQRLTIRQRLALFRTVCQAVQHAHGNLVVHRDLKPSNILVARDGNVKLLDFGIAKVLAPGDSSSPAALTRTNERPMTPEYASPEQIRGSAIATTSDVYALGVVLYELLAGRKPYMLSGTTLRELEEAICEREPLPPSAADELAGSDIAAARGVDPRRLRRQLSGDLDNIVLMALRKEPQRRYASVERFSEDVRRHLVGLPVGARPDTLGYRMRKFISRNRVAVGFATGLATVLIGASVVLAVLAGRLAQQRDDAQEARKRTQEHADRADNQAAQKEKTIAFLREMFRAAEPALERGDDPAVLENMLITADKCLASELAGIESAQAVVRFTIGAAYRFMGRFEAAETNLRESLRLVRLAEPLNERLLVDALNELAMVRRTRDDPEEAIRLYEEAIARFRRLYGEHDPELAQLYSNAAYAKMDVQDYAGAESLLRDAQSILEHNGALESQPGAHLLNMLGLTLRRQGRLIDARLLYRRAVDIAEASVGRDDPRRALYLSNLANVLSFLNQTDEAEAAMREALRVQRLVFPGRHLDTATTLDNLARLLAQTNRADQADELSREALAMFEQLVGSGHSDYALAQLIRAEVLLKQERWDEAVQTSRAAVATLRTTRGERDLATLGALNLLGESLAARGDFAEAEPLLLESLRGNVEAFGQQHEFTRGVRASVARFYERWGRPQQAARHASSERTE